MATLPQYAIGIVLFGHGWVHLVYAASNLGWFGSDSAWAWNGRSLLLSGVLDRGAITGLTSVGFVVAGLLFLAGAVGYVFAVGPWSAALVIASVLSVLGYLALWDGALTGLAERGAVGVLLDLVVLGWLLFLS